jgi:hypothetical protein
MHKFTVGEQLIEYAYEKLKGGEKGKPEQNAIIFVCVTRARRIRTAFDGNRHSHAPVGISKGARLNGE